MTQPTPPAALAVTDALIAAANDRTIPDIWRTTYGDVVGVPMSLARVAVEALAAAGRLTTNGRCGNVLTPLTAMPAAYRPVCDLTAGHTGWHRADNGCEWGEVQP